MHRVKLGYQIKRARRRRRRRAICKSGEMVWRT
jgi:hypothetical protein